MILLQCAIPCRSPSAARWARALLPAVLVLSGCGATKRYPNPDELGEAPGTGGSISSSMGGGTSAGGTSAGSTSSEGMGGGVGLAPTGPTIEYPNPPREEAPIGWASVNADGQDGTFGGRAGEVVLVATAQALREAVSGAMPRIVRVTNSFDAGQVAVGSNKTVEGAEGVTLRVALQVNGQSNVIVRDLTLRGNGCAGLTDCSAGSDVVEIRGSDHVWFHHVDVADGDDGNLDIVRGSDYVTVSFSRFSYSNANRQHRFSNLIGNGDDVPEDVGHLRVTWHDNWWAENVDQRMPRTRRGRIHVFNNLFTSVGNSYCTNAGFEASLLVENNIYSGVNDPLDPTANGDMLARGNVFIDTEGTDEANGVGFVPDYEYTLDSTDGLEEQIRGAAGPRPAP